MRSVRNYCDSMSGKVRLYTEDEDRIIGEMREKQYSTKEIAKALGRTPSGIRQRITYLRCLHRIR